MLAFLLATAVSASPVPLTPQVAVAFPNAAPVTVSGPVNSEQNAEYPWMHEQTLLSPRGDAAAVRFCWEAVKYQGCRVYLVRPSGTVVELKNSNVTRLLWTADGKYLIGAGANTVRLWNLVGGVRTAVPTPGEVYAQSPQHSSRIVGLTLRGRDLCVPTEGQWYDRNGQQTGRSVSTTRYALPTLRPLETISQPAEAGQQASCFLPRTEP